MLLQGKILSCKVCNKEFYVSISILKRGKKCCSRKCAGVLRQKRKDLNCKICNKKFSVRLSIYKNGRKFCSAFCRDKSPEYHPNKGKGIKVCKICSKKFINYCKTTLYCSNRCRGISKRSKRIVTYCKVCKKKIISTEYRHNLGLGKYCSKKHEGIGRRINVTRIRYASDFNSKLKEQIRKRDNYTCQLCGITEEEHIVVLGRVLDIHHVDYNKQNSKEDNLLTLCRQCNLRVNFNREHWNEYFKELMKNGYKRNLSCNI